MFPTLGNYTLNTLLKSAGLAIHGASSALVKTTVASTYKIAGIIYAALGAADLPALTGINVATGFTIAVLVQVDTAGTVTYKASSAVANVTGQIFLVSDVPSLDKDKAAVGAFFIKNTSGSTFTGGSTNLDASGIAVTYVDALGVVGS